MQLLVKAHSYVPIPVALCALGILLHPSWSENRTNPLAIAGRVRRPTLSRNGPRPVRLPLIVAEIQRIHRPVHRIDLTTSKVEEG